MKKTPILNNYFASFLIESFVDAKGLLDGSKDYKFFAHRLLTKLVHVSALFWLADAYLSLVLKFIKKWFVRPFDYYLVEASLLFVLYFISSIILKHSNTKGDLEKNSAQREFKNLLIKYNLINEFYIGIIFLSLVFLLTVGIYLSDFFIDYPRFIYEP